MSDDEKKPLVEIPSDVLGVGKATEALTDKLARAAGVLYEPRRIRLKSKEEREAEREAALTRARTAIEVADLEQRATFRRRYEEIREQANLEAILDKATSQMSGNNVAPEKMDDDWVNQFVNKAKLVSKEEMQDWWSKIIARESQKAGSFAPKTLEVVSVMKQSDAELFRNLCDFVTTGATHEKPLVFDETAPVYQNNGITYDGLQHLAALGLITYEILGVQTNYIPQKEQRAVPIVFKQFLIVATLPAGRDNLPSGRVMFTRAGLELFRICEGKFIPAFLNYIAEEYKKHDIKCDVASMVVGGKPL